MSKKLYITGGIGASGVGEAFGGGYELPNLTAYNETCASIGMDFWNHRLFLLHGDAKYIDVMERTLYNGLISGVALDGKTFFYPNPLESRGQYQRSPWFGVACCPGNIARFLPSVPGYVYAKTNDAIFVNLFVQGTGEIALDGNRAVKLTQQTRYPWDGAVKITVAPEPAGTFAINVRIPGWAREEPVPGDLYRFLDTAPPATLKVNGVAVPLAIDKGFVRISRAWQRGDTIDLDLPMPVRRVVANEKVADDAGRVALQRGPIVYAAEWPDHPGGRVRNLVLPDASSLTSQFLPTLLNGVTVVRGRARALAADGRGGVTATDLPLIAIPYATWANRGPGEMIVWLPRTDAGAHPTPVPDAGHHRHDHGVGADRGARQEHASHRRRRGAALVRRRVVVLRLVAHARQRRRVGRDGVREASDDLGDLGLLVRRHRPRLGARPGHLAAALQGRRRLEAGRGRRRLRRRARSLQPRVVQAGHDGRLADRSDHAADVLGRAPGVDGEVGGTARGDLYKVMSPRRTASRTAPVRAVRAQLAADRCDVELHRLVADAEAPRDALVGEALREQFEHFDLARRQGLDLRVVGGVRVGSDEKGIRLGAGRSRLPQICCFPDDGQRPVGEHANPGTRDRRADQDHAQVTQGVPPP